MKTAQQLDPGFRAQRLEEATVHAGKINGSLARHAVHRIRTRRGMPPSYRQTNSSPYTVNGRGGERVPSDGVDSATFFKGLDSMQTLITTYHQPLLRLAQR